MDEVRVRLEGIGDALLDVLGDVYADGSAPVDDTELLDLARSAADALRRIEGVLVQVTGEIRERSASSVREERLTTRWGCRSVSELVQSATRLGPSRVSDLERVARGTHRKTALTGESLDPDFPAVRDALREGSVGADAAAAIIVPLAAAQPRAGRLGILAADRELVAAARGEVPVRRDGAEGEGAADGDGTVHGDGDAEQAAEPPATAGELRALAQVWAAYLDQDGAEPGEDAALRKRSLTLGRARDGVVPVRGNLLVDVAAQLERLTHAILNPKNPPGVCFIPDPADDDIAGGARADEGTGARTGVDAAAGAGAGAGAGELPAPVDTRTRPQRQHDAFATMLIAAAASGGLPEIGGAAPTLVVTVPAENLTAGTGYATIRGHDHPVPLSVAAHTGCTGAIQRVTQNPDGRIVSLGFIGRVFSAHQRRAILTRDHGCVIPGCDTPPEWCEIHHVTEHSRGGPTHTDNGVAVCWHHHRTLGGSGWDIRMNHGVPEIRGPAWWDRHRRWRPARNRRWRPPA